MKVPALVYILLLAVVIAGPVMANVAYNGWKKPVLSRIFLLISGLAMVTLIVLVLI